MTSIRNQILIRLELQCAVRALKHVCECCADAATREDLELLIAAVLQLYDATTTKAEKD